MVTTVSNAGGLGGYGAYNLEPEQLIEIDKEIKAGTDKPYVINTWVSDVDKEAYHYTADDFEKLKEVFTPYFNELNIPVPEMPVAGASKFEMQAETILRIKPPVFSFIFGIPSKEILKECKKQNIKTIGAATTPDEAMALEEAQVDLIIATGFEAGGHRPSFIRSAQDSLTGTFALIPQIADKVKTPIIAAGGIADGNGIAAALTLGASAVQIGTAFLACEESNATHVHKELLFSPVAKHTTLTKAFTGRLARGISSIIAEETKNLERDFAPFPLQSIFLSPLRAAAIAQNKPGMITFWAGQALPLLKHKTAGKLMQSLISQTEEIFNSFSFASNKIRKQ